MSDQTFSQGHAKMGKPVKVLRDVKWEMVQREDFEAVRLHVIT